MIYRMSPVGYIFTKEEFLAPFYGLSQTLVDERAVYWESLPEVEVNESNRKDLEDKMLYIHDVDKSFVDKMRVAQQMYNVTMNKLSQKIQNDIRRTNHSNDLPVPPLDDMGRNDI